jgi:hypothetical protein
MKAEVVEAAVCKKPDVNMYDDCIAQKILGADTQHGELVFLIGYWKFYLTTLVCTGQLDIVINWIKPYDYCIEVGQGRAQSSGLGPTLI